MNETNRLNMSGDIYTVIQNTWNEEDDKDLLNYVKVKNINTLFLSEDEILKMDNSKIDALFCDTSIVQKKIIIL